MKCSARGFSYLFQEGNGLQIMRSGRQQVCLHSAGKNNKLECGARVGSEMMSITSRVNILFVGSISTL